MECGVASKRSLHMPNCSKVRDCDRSYVLYLPNSLCRISDSGFHTNNVTNTGKTVNVSDVAPLVFAFHCLGCTAQTMMHWTTLAESYNFILAIPEGLQNSWNAINCCGYALANKIDDVGFVGRIVETLSGEQQFSVSKSVVYAMGWSNGGYLATYAAFHFRAVAPISGHVYDDFNVVTKNKPTGLFMHHSSDDRFVQITGCCTDPTQPKCCCGISQHGSDTCTSATQVVTAWAKDVNGCNDDDADTLQVTMRDSNRGITCHGVSSSRKPSNSSCRANATLCIHEHGAHFNNPSFTVAFDMHDDIADFFAADACAINGGKWSSSRRLCTCRSAREHDDSAVVYGGSFCLTAVRTTNAIDTMSDPRSKQMQDDSVVPFAQNVGKYWGSLLGIIFIATVALAVGGFKKKTKYKGWNRVAVQSEDDDTSGMEMQRRNRVV